jgi:hypothetical protein
VNETTFLGWNGWGGLFSQTALGENPLGGFTGGIYPELPREAPTGTKGVAFRTGSWNWQSGLAVGIGNSLASIKNVTALLLFRILDIQWALEFSLFR